MASTVATSDFPKKLFVTSPFFLFIEFKLFLTHYKTDMYIKLFIEYIIC